MAKALMMTRPGLIEPTTCVSLDAATDQLVPEIRAATVLTVGRAERTTVMTIKAGTTGVRQGIFCPRMDTFFSRECYGRSLASVDSPKTAEFTSESQFPLSKS